MIDYADCSARTPIGPIVCRMVELANQRNESVRAVIRGIEIIAHPGSDAFGIIRFWQQMRCQKPMPELALS
jgi:hypothetical protein